MKTPARRVHTGNYVADAAQRNGSDVAKRLNAAIFDGGVLLTEESGQPAKSGLSFSAGNTRSLPHSLGRKAVGFLEVYAADVPSSANVALRSAAMPSGLSSATHISVTPTNTGTCFLFVF